MEMEYELKEFGNRKYKVPTDWTPGNLVAWEEGDATHYGMVVELRFNEEQPHIRMGRNHMRWSAHFSLDMVSADGLHNFGLSHTVERGEEHGRWGAWVRDRLEPSLPRKIDK